MIERRKLPSREDLLSMFTYHRELGVLIWKNHWNPSCNTKFRGKVAGCVNRNGYRHVNIGNHKFKVHRLIWFLEFGEEPEAVDHINGDTLDNRVVNLKGTTQRENCLNKLVHRTGQLPGVTYVASRQKWQAQIKRGRQNEFLGRFDTQLEAHNAYLAAFND